MIIIVRNVVSVAMKALLVRVVYKTIVVSTNEHNSKHKNDKDKVIHTFITCYVSKVVKMLYNCFTLLF